MYAHNRMPNMRVKIIFWTVELKRKIPNATAGNLLGGAVFSPPP
jgi:hypothetical protein